MYIVFRIKQYLSNNSDTHLITSLTSILLLKSPSAGYDYGYGDGGESTLDVRGCNDGSFFNPRTYTSSYVPSNLGRPFGGSGEHKEPENKSRRPLRRITLRMLIHEVVWVSIPQ